jgi:predicted nucleotidyltransferase
VTELARVVERLVSAFHPDRIYAFGSQVRGEAEPESDIDLLIVVPHASEPAHRLAQAAYHALPAHSLPIDILVMSRDEFEQRSRAASSLPATILREGRTLYAA